MRYCTACAEREPNPSVQKCRQCSSRAFEHTPCLIEWATLIKAFDWAFLRSCKIDPEVPDPDAAPHAGT